MPKPKLTWERNDVLPCYCDMSSMKPHKHCPCINCEYSPVAGYTECRHRQQFSQFNSLDAAGGVMDDEDVIDDEEDMPEVVDGGNRCSSNSDSDSVLTDDENNSFNEQTGSCDDSEIGIQSSDSEENDHEMVEQPNDINDDYDDNNKNFVMIKNLLQTLTLASQMNASINMTEKLLVYVGSLVNKFADLGAEWPKTYATATSVLKATGLYADPIHHKICFNSEHPAHFYVLDPGQSCPDCDIPPTIHRYYLPIKDKIRRWFISETVTSKMLGHWKNRDKWLEKTGVTYPLNEIWDGYRFKELQWFWDPDSSWPIPQKCCNCSIYINLMDLQITSNEMTEIQCFNCNTKQLVRPKIVSGDPRNIGFIGHWDGWTPIIGRGAARSTGSIELNIATMEKIYRCRNEHVYTSTFVPERDLPNRTPTSLDPFLEPLVSELEELFVEGMEVEYPLDVGEIKAGRFTVRCILLCWTGDYPAQCQVGKFSNKGTYGCRVDECQGVSVERSSTKYYTNNRHRFSNPWPKRNFEADYETMQEIEELPNPAAKLRRAKEIGLTGLSVLANLNFLYGFDVFKDMVRDVMHLVCLNLARKLFKRYFNDEEFDLDLFEEKLKDFPFTSEMLDGHCPKNLSKFNSWTAEEWQKFAYPVSEMLFVDCLTYEEYHITYLTARLVELLFHHRSGLDEAEMETLRKICWRRVVLLEERVGEKQCVITAHNSLHIPEDIERFAHSDNFWCWSNERVVKRYKDLSTNCKNIEATYAKLEVKREVLAVAELKIENTTYKTDVVNGIVSSVEAAKNFVYKDERSLVFIGATSLTNVRIADEAIQERMVSLDRGEVEVFRTYRACYLNKQNSVLKIDSFVLLQSGDVGKIGEFIFVKNDNGPYKFVRVELFSLQQYVNLHDIPTLNATGNNAVVEIECVKRKVIVYLNNDTLFCRDFDRPSFNFDFDAMP